MKKIYALLWLITFVVVPWRQWDPITRTKQIARDLEFHCLFSPPKTYGSSYREYKVDFTQLLLEWGALLSVGAVFFAFRRDQTPQNDPVANIDLLSEASSSPDEQPPAVEPPPPSAEPPRPYASRQSPTPPHKHEKKRVVYSDKIAQESLRASQSIPNYGSANQKSQVVRDHNPEAIIRQLEAWRKKRPTKRETPSSTP